MRELRHQLMRREIMRRLAAAEILSVAQDDSDSAYLLRLIALELLLKLVLERSTQSRSRGHDYHALFERLPPEIQRDILRRAGERIGPSALNSKHKKVLQDLGGNFVELRYPYEKYDSMSMAEYQQHGENWIASGAALEEADYRYHPEELLGLTTALQQIVEAG